MSIPLSECFVNSTITIPNQVRFNAKSLHSVDHVSCYVCSATFGHNYPKTKEKALVWIKHCVVASSKRAGASILDTILLVVAKLSCDPVSATQHNVVGTLCLSLLAVLVFP